MGGDTIDSANIRQQERHVLVRPSQPLGYDMMALILYIPFNFECAIMSGVIFQGAEVNCCLSKLIAGLPNYIYFKNIETFPDVCNKLACCWNLQEGGSKGKTITQ